MKLNLKRHILEVVLRQMLLVVLLTLKELLLKN
ncbi:hypothetical protein A3Q56_07997 [Intoshia linei]|uniref:Uncharacterized protein n=1 Tax=Intoshia linei TaxID=1819745 RepID=A0A177ASE0_9BILA|nr:hypothetical protein A3Q56_07997 [Intoshia linei]